MGPITRTCSALGAALLALSGTAARANVPPGQGAEAFVHARGAEIASDWSGAAAAWRVALAAGDDPLVALRAYRAGLTVGDERLTRDAVAALVARQAAPADAVLWQLADAIARDDTRATDARLAALNGGPFEFLMPLVQAWRSDDPALVPLGSNDALVRRYAGRTHALLRIANGQVDAGLAAIRADTSNDARWDAARLLVARGDAAGAAALVAKPGAVPAAKAGAGFGLAELYLRLAADLGEQGAGTIPVLLARAALRVDPANERARLVLAEALLGEGAAGPAGAVLAAIPDGSALAEDTRRLHARVLTAGGDQAGALAQARQATVAAPGSLAAWRLYAQLAALAGTAAEEAEAQRRALDLAGTAATPLDIVRAADALDRADRWAEARPLLARALAAAPTDATVLNAVGYARLARGEDPRAARALLERAHAAEPDDHAILDSIGWAYVVTGEPERGVPLLERAIASPDPDAVIAEHLGDAYWAVGRRFEARHAWQAAASASDDPAVAARLKVRIADGPPPAR